MKTKFIAFLLALFSPHVVDDESYDEPVEDYDEPLDDEYEEIEDGSEEIDEEIDEPVPERKISKAQQEIINLRKRAQEAEERERKVREDLESARRPSQSAQPTQEQAIWEQEEAVLKNPESTEWHKYSVQTAREARAAKLEVSRMRSESQDALDRAKFEKYETTKPKLYAKYKDKVESTLAEMRKAGNNAPREDLLALFIGRDLRDGKTKSTEAKTKQNTRGSTPGVRSNVTAKGGLSEAERRAKRLENVRI